MALHINRPGKTAGSRPRLSSFGKGVVAAAVIILIAAVFLAVNTGMRASRISRAQDSVDIAVERVTTVAKQAYGEGDNTLNEALDAIKNERSVDRRVSRALELIDGSLKKTAGNSALTDELNGARNRLLRAYEAYETEKK